MKRKIILTAIIAIAILTMAILGVACNKKEVEMTGDEVKVESIKTDVKELLMVTGESFTLGYTLVPNANSEVTFESDSEAIRVENTGKITAVAPGVATVTVKLKDGDVKDQCVITVGDIIVDKGDEESLPQEQSQGQENQGQQGQNQQGENTGDNQEGATDNGQGQLNQNDTEGEQGQNQNGEQNGEQSQNGTNEQNSQDNDDAQTNQEQVLEENGNGDAQTNQEEVLEENSSNGNDENQQNQNSDNQNNENQNNENQNNEDQQNQNGQNTTRSLVINVGGKEGETLFKSMTQAVANAKNGDVILVKTGVYDESVSVNKTLTIKGLKDVKVKKIRIETSGDLTLENVTLTDESFPLGNDARVYVASQGKLTIKNCIIETTKEGEPTGGYAIFAEKQCKGLDIEKNVLSNFRYGIYVCPTDQQVKITQNKLSNMSVGIGLDVRQENSQLNYPTKGEISDNEYNEVQAKTQFLHYGEDYDGDFSFDDNENDTSSNSQPQGLEE